MPVKSLRLYRHFPTLPDTYALLALLRMHAIEFVTRFERGASYGKGGSEPSRIEVWVRATDYAQVAQLEAALTHEQVFELAENYQLITLPDAKLRQIARQNTAQPSKAAVAATILRDRKSYPLPNEIRKEVVSAEPTTGRLPKRWGLVLLLGGLYLLGYWLLK